jgi:hypothetical protein
MIKQIGLLLIVMIVSISLTGATASQDDKYTVVPAKSDETTLRWVTDTITQGEINWHYKSVSSYTTSLHIDLNWGDSSDSLRLKVYNPDDELVRTFYDIADDVIDGRININIQSSEGIDIGTWRYEVYGHHVTGTEDYYI